VKHLIGFAALVAASLLFVVGAASGAGEPKNQPPFTRAVATRTLQASHAHGAIDVRGEAKNQMPFTRLVQR
jgi:hypothetical protein